MPESSRDELKRRLQQYLGADNIIVDQESQRPYECDALTIYCDLPLLVALPETTVQVQQVLQWMGRSPVSLILHFQVQLLPQRQLQLPALLQQAVILLLTRASG